MVLRGQHRAISTDPGKGLYEVALFDDLSGVKRKAIRMNLPDSIILGWGET